MAAIRSPPWPPQEMKWPHGRPHAKRRLIPSSYRSFARSLSYESFDAAKTSRRLLSFFPFALICSAFVARLSLRRRTHLNGKISKCPHVSRSTNPLKGGGHPRPPSRLFSFYDCSRPTARPDRPTGRLASFRRERATIETTRAATASGRRQVEIGITSHFFLSSSSPSPVLDTRFPLLTSFFCFQTLAEMTTTSSTIRRQLAQDIVGLSEADAQSLTDLIKVRAV